MLTVIVVVGATVSVIVTRVISNSVVVDGIPANSVVLVLTGAAVMIVVIVLVATGLPMHEQAVASVPARIDLRLATASLVRHQLSV